MTDKELRERTEILKAITRAVRKADEGFKTTGGSSRHWVCEQFLPCLEEGGLTIMPTAALKDAYREGVEDMRDAANRKIAKYYGGLAATHVFIGLADVTDEAARLLEEKPRAPDPEKQELVEQLADCVCQIEYLHAKFQETGSGNTTLVRSRALLRPYF